MRVIEVPAGENLAPFSAFLWQHRVAHRIFEERGQQIVELADADAAAEVRRAYDAWQAGTLTLEAVAVPAANQPHRSAVLETLRGVPGVLTILLLSLAVFPFSLALVSGRPGDVALALTVVDLRVHGSVDLAVLASELQPWRWLTPMFLHFSITHIAFNSVVTFDLGRRIEAVLGTSWLILIVVVIGLVSNLGQVLMNENPLFGGLSGVAYGLLGFLLVMARLDPGDERWQLPKGFAFSLVLFLVLMSTGITEFFGLYIANAAHWSGFICGGLLAALLSTQKKGRVNA